MASLCLEPNGRRKLQFSLGDGKRRSLRLGKISDKAAASIRSKVEDLVNAKLTGEPCRRATAEWIAGLDDPMHTKLAAVQLVQPRRSASLGPFIDSYKAVRSDVGRGTQLTYQRARCHLVEFFGEDRDLRDITEGDAVAWRAWMVSTRGLAENTAAKSAANARLFMKHALQSRRIESNPFANLQSTVHGNRDRQRFIEAATIAQVVDACPDHEWRLMIMLARYLGLRVPSELLALRWSDVDWERRRITVHASKTKRSASGGVRVVPLFPQVEPYMVEAFEQAEPGSEFIIARYRNSKVNLRTQFIRIIERAGVKPWPKLWQNLRATRATELVRTEPDHVVNAFMGHTTKCAHEHYRQTTDDDYERALQNAVHYPVQNRPAATGSGQKPNNVRETQAPAASAVARNLGKRPEVAGSREKRSNGPGKIRTCDLTLIRTDNRRFWAENGDFYPRIELVCRDFASRGGKDGGKESSDQTRTRGKCRCSPYR